MSSDLIDKMHNFKLKNYVCNGKKFNYAQFVLDTAEKI